MNRETPWEFDDCELPRWARSSHPEPQASSFSWRTVPGPLPASSSLVVRSFVWRLVLAFVLAVLLLCGAAWYANGTVGSAAATAAVLGLQVGFVSLLILLIGRHQNALARAAGYVVDNREVSLVSPLVFFPIAAPLFVFLAVAAYRFFPHPFTSVLLLAPVCLLLQAWLAQDVLALARDKLLVNESISRDERDRRSRDPIKPDLLPLAACLAIVLVIPAFFSTTAGIMVLIGALAYLLTERFRPALKYGPLRIVAAGLLNRAEQIASEYCDYDPTEDFHWRPKRTRRKRFWTFLAATWVLDLIFLVGLTGFFPWELAAGLSVDGYDLPSSIVTHYQTGNYQWLLTPVELASKADPLGLYLVGLILAALLFVLVTPAMLLAIYLPGLIELENLAQQIKKHHPTTGS